MKSPATKRAVVDRWTQDRHLSRRCVLEHLKEIAQAQGATVSQTVTEIDKSRQGGNLSSAIRLFVLDWVRSGQMGKQV